MGAHSWRHGTCTTSVCRHASGVCPLIDVSLSSRSLCLLSFLQHLSVLSSRLGTTSLAAPRHPLHPPSPEPGITVAVTGEFALFSPGPFHSVPVSYLAATFHLPFTLVKIAPWQRCLEDCGQTIFCLPKKMEDKKTGMALRDHLQCS